MTVKLSSFQKPRSRGFSLIELILIIVVIGTLTAVVAANFFDTEAAAHTQNLNSVAGALNVASAKNHTRAKLGKSFTTVTNCTDIATAVSKPLPAGFTITPLAISNGAEVTCTVTSNANNQSATFMGIGVQS